MKAIVSRLIILCAGAAIGAIGMWFYQSSTGPPSIPIVYDKYFVYADEMEPPQMAEEAEGYPVRLGFIARHYLFKHEPRDRTWASAMEAEIDRDIKNAHPEGWAVIDYRTCRSHSCEIGFYVTDMAKARNLIGDDTLKSDLWPEKPKIYTAQFNFPGDTDKMRFIYMISTYDHQELLPVLESL